jgi:hypothetical protein
MAYRDLSRNAFRNAQRLLDRTYNDTFEPVTTITRQDADDLAYQMKLDPNVTNYDGSSFDINNPQGYFNNGVETYPYSNDNSEIVETDLNQKYPNFNLNKEQQQKIDLIREPEPEKTFLEQNLDMVKNQFSKDLTSLKKTFFTYNWDFLKDLKSKSSSLVNIDAEAAVENDLIKFKQKLASKESTDNYKAVNKKGAIGKWQFTNARLDHYMKENNTRFTRKDFLDSEQIQEKVYNWHVKNIIDYIEEHKLEKYIGTTINGTEITLEGMLAGAHIGGNFGLRKYLKSGGTYNPDDGNTSISDYVKEFGKK